MLFQWSIEPLRLGAQQDIAGLREAVGATIKARNVHGPFIDDLPIKMSLVGGLEHEFYVPFHIWDVIPTPLTNSYFLFINHQPVIMGF